MAHISESQKQILHQAVDTASARFIAQVVINIEEIVVCIKQFLALNCDDKNETVNNEVAAAEFDIKVEPGLESSEPSELGKTVLDSTTGLTNSATPTSPTLSSEQRKRRTGRRRGGAHKLVTGKQQLTQHANEVSEPQQQPNIPVYRISEPSGSDNSKRLRSCSAPDCTFVAGSRADLKKHLLTYHPSLCETIFCEHCSFTTKKRANYRQHVKIHLAPEDKPFKCSQCSYSSTNKEGLDMHVNSAHKGVKPYLCDACGQSFTGISMLSKHKLMKHKPKHLSCPHCDYKTSLQTWMKDHMKKHSNHTPFMCQFCSYATKTAGRLKVHLRIHTGERPYKCHLCDYAAMEGAPLKKHLKNQHQLVVSRIDVREGKLILKDGRVVLTGLATRTMPLPPGSHLGSNQPPDAAPSETDLIRSATTTNSTVNILIQAATLSALPVHPESPPLEESAAGGSMQYHTGIAPGFLNMPNRLPATEQDNSYR